MPIKIIIKPGVVEKRDETPRCLVCAKQVTPGMCYTGKVLQGFADIRRTESGYGVEDSGSSVIKLPRSYTLHGIPMYDRGYLCDECASNYHTATHHKRNGEIVQVPVVVTDRLHTIEPKEEISGPRNYKGFNTRVTR